MKQLLYSLCFLAYCTVFVIVGVFICDAVPAWPHGLLRATVPGSSPIGHGSTQLRLAEAQGVSQVDVLLMGSSHAYRGLDTRVFRDNGLKTFNLGTKSQTPMVSYYLLRRYIQGFSPKLVVYEVFPKVLDNNYNLESFYDIASNGPLDWHLLRMAFSTGSPLVYRHLLSLVPARSRLDVLNSTHINRAEMGDIYISGGFVENPATFKLSPPPAQPIHVSESQLEYLFSLVKLVRDSGANIVFVSHPLPSTSLEVIENYDYELQKVRQRIESWNVPFLNLQSALGPLETSDYGDWQHLSIKGAKRFSQAIFDQLKSDGLLPQSNEGHN